MQQRELLLIFILFVIIFIIAISFTFAIFYFVTFYKVKKKVNTWKYTERNKQIYIYINCWKISYDFFLIFILKKKIHVFQRSFLIHQSKINTALLQIGLYRSILYTIYSHTRYWWASIQFLRNTMFTWMRAQIKQNEENWNLFYSVMLVVLFISLFEFMIKSCV